MTKALNDLIEAASAEVDALELRLDAARKRREDLLLTAHEAYNYSISELGRLSGIRRESAHYAIVRAKTRREFDEVLK